MLHCVTPSHRVAPAVLGAHDQVGPAAELRQRLALDLARESLQVWPDLEARYPLAHDLATGAAERHAHDRGALATEDLLQRLVAGGVIGVGEQAREHQHLRLHGHTL